MRHIVPQNDEAGKVSMVLYKEKVYFPDDTIESVGSLAELRHVKVSEKTVDFLRNLPPGVALNTLEAILSDNVRRSIISR